jgi:hypothetical protein
MAILKGLQADGLLSSQAAAELTPPGLILGGHFSDLVRGSDGFLYPRPLGTGRRGFDKAAKTLPQGAPGH